MWWKDMLWGFWNGMTAWFVLIAHAFGKLQRQPVFDAKRTARWYAFGFLVGVSALSGRKDAKPPGTGKDDA
jgi:hypothetical protein